VQFNIKHRIQLVKPRFQNASPFRKRSIIIEIIVTWQRRYLAAARWRMATNLIANRSVLAPAIK
jgi:hypothetical protein